MIKLLILILTVIGSCKGLAQINNKSLIGKYVYTEWIGGGFVGGPNGECMATPPELKIDNTLIIDANFVVTKVSDTTVNYGLKTIKIDFNCDTLFLGTAQIAADTVVLTYNLKPNCQNFFYLKDSKKPERYKKLKTSIIERYVLWIVENEFYGLTICGADGGNYQKIIDPELD